MPVDRVSAVRLAAAVAGLENHDERIRNDPEFAYLITRNPTLLREFHATLGIGNRLWQLAGECDPPVIFDVTDINDGALVPPFRLDQRSHHVLLKYMRELVAKSAIARIEVTAARDIVLHSFVYQCDRHQSVLEPVESSVPLPLRRSA